MTMRVSVNPGTWDRLAAKVRADDPNRVDFSCHFRDFHILHHDESGPLGTFPVGDGDLDSRLMTERSYRQYLSRLGIPFKVATLFSGDLQGQMIAERLQDPNLNLDKEIFVRARPGHVRALLSDRYGDMRDREVVDILDELIPNLDGYEVFRGVATDELFAVTLLGRDPVHANGDRYFPIHVVRNSEVGASSFNVTSGICKGACSNGMIFGLKKDTQFRIRHLGARMRENVEAVLNKAFSNVDAWGARIAPAISRAKEVAINLEDDKQKDKAVKQLRDRGLTKKNAERVLAFSQTLPEEVYGSEFTQGPQVTQWHVINAMTHLAQDPNVFDEFQRFEIEAAAGALLLAA